MTVIFNNESNPYRAAGTYCGLSYIPRKADEQLLNAIHENQRYPYCLSPRQSGKSSLLVNTANRLGNDFHSIFIDFSVIPANELSDFDNFLSFLTNKIQSSINFEAKTIRFVELSEIIKAIIKGTEKRIIIFLDEIDVLLTSSFKELLFAQIRSVFNERSRDISLSKVQFVLAGVAQPTDLISSVNMSPFNVGIHIELESLTKEQVIYATRLLKFETENNQIKLGKKIFYYTNGSVYLTQLILERLWENQKISESIDISTKQVNKIVGQIISEADKNIHFVNIYNQLQNNIELLSKFALFNEGKDIDFASIKALEIIGITDGLKPYRNLIYKKVFDSNKSLSLFQNKSDSPHSISELKAVSKPSFTNVPFASKGKEFIGRKALLEKIWKLLNQLERGETHHIVSIQGLGGIGKTQLAIEYAHKYRDQYSNGIFWLAANEDIDSQLIKIGQGLNWISQYDQGFNQAELVASRLRKLSDCLIIFDNLNNVKDIRNYLPNKDVHSHILITSRKDNIGSYPLELKPLQYKEAQNLLLNISKRKINNIFEKKSLDKILKELGGLPLAIELSGGYLSQNKEITFQDYYKSLKNKSFKNLENRFTKDFFIQYGKRIIQGIKIDQGTYDKNQYLEDILDILAWSGKSSMGYSLLRELIATTDDSTLEKDIKAAFELRFLEKEGTNRYRIHPLISLVLQIDKPLEDRKEWHYKIVNNLKKWFSYRYRYFYFLQEFEAEFEHLAEWQRKTISIFPIEGCYLTAFLSKPAWRQGNYKESLSYILQAQNLYIINQINDLELLGFLYNERSIYSRYLSNYQDALFYQKESLMIREEIFGRNHPDIADSLSNLALIHENLGEYQNAVTYQMDALKIREEIFGRNHPDIADSLSNLALIYENLGEYQKAIRYQMNALRTFIDVLGKEHTHTILICSNLINVLLKVGEIEKVIKLVDEFLPFVPFNHPNKSLFDKYAVNIHQKT